MVKESKNNIKNDVVKTSSSRVTGIDSSVQKHKTILINHPRLGFLR
jgi:hypothetical protein